MQPRLHETVSANPPLLLCLLILTGQVRTYSGSFSKHMALRALPALGPNIVILLGI